MNNQYDTIRILINLRYNAQSINGFPRRLAVWRLGFVLLNDMDFKKCSVCHLTKPITDFSLRYKKKNLSTYRYNCKKCVSRMSKKYYSYDRKKSYIGNRKYHDLRKTNIHVFIKLKYRSMKNRVNHKNKKRFGSYNNIPICSRDEFIKFASNSNPLKTLYKEWQDSGYKLQLTPSVDRIVNEKGYVINNIQFLTFKENTLKS